MTPAVSIEAETVASVRRGAMALSPGLQNSPDTGCVGARIRQFFHRDGT
jgi:hypothetical protein